MRGRELSTLVVILSLPSPPQASSEGIAVVLCVCVCDIKFFVLATTFSPSTRETLSCCKKLSPLDRRLLSSSQKRQKLVVCRNAFKKFYCHIVQALGYLKASKINDRASQYLKKICGDLLYSLLFMSYGSVKILTSHFPRGAPLQMRLVVS